MNSPLSLLVLSYRTKSLSSDESAGSLEWSPSSTGGTNEDDVDDGCSCGQSQDLESSDLLFQGGDQHEIDGIDDQQRNMLSVLTSSLSEDSRLMTAQKLLLAGIPANV